MVDRAADASRRSVMVPSDIPPLGLDHEPVVVKVTGHLIDFLMSRKLSPGSRLPSERQLAEALGIGRSTVREALKSLSLLGLVEIRQGSGHFVSSAETGLLPKVIRWGLLLGDRQVQDLLEARQHIEVTVARLAAKRRTGSDLDELSEHLEAMRVAGSPSAFQQHDVAFHLALARSSGNSALHDILRSLESLMHVWITRVLDRSEEELDVLYRQHETVFEAVRDRLVDEAGDAMAAHLSDAYQRLGEWEGDDRRR